MTQDKQDIIITIGVVVALLGGGVWFYFFGPTTFQPGLSFSEIESVMHYDCTGLQHIDVLTYVGPGDTQTRRWTVKNERSGTTTTSISPVTLPNDFPRYYERVTSPIPPDTRPGDTLDITLLVQHKISPPQTQTISYRCDSGPQPSAPATSLSSLSS